MFTLPKKKLFKVTELIGFGSGGGGLPSGIHSVIYTGNNGSNSYDGSMSVAAGSPHPNRYLVGFCTHGGISSSIETTPTIGGVAATLAAREDGGTHGSSAVFFAKVPTGTSVTVTCTGSGTNSQMALVRVIVGDDDVLSLLEGYNQTANTINNTFTTSIGTSILVGASVKGYGTGHTWNSTTGVSVTEMYDRNRESTHYHSAGYAGPEQIDATTESFRIQTSGTGASAAMASLGV